MHKKGIATGVFDLFHRGHKGFLDFCRERCSSLEVRLHDDDFAEGHKRVRPVLDFATRRRALLAYGVDEVVPAGSWEEALRADDGVLFAGQSQEEITRGLESREIAPMKGPKTAQLRGGLQLFPSQPDSLKKVTSILESNGVEHCIMFGTLLGAMRNGRKIPWDKDYDVLVFDRGMEETRGLFRGMGLTQHNSFLSVMQGARVDVFFVDERGRVPHLSGHRLPLEGARPFERIEVDGVEVNAPANRREIVDFHYPGWECNFSVWKACLPSKFDVNF